MPTTKTKARDNRAELYKSVRISKKAYAKLAKRAKDERRTIVATLEILLGA